MESIQLSEIKPFLKLFETPYLSMATFHPKKGIQSFISNYPAEWISHYNYNQYYHHDVALTKNLKPFSPFVWGLSIVDHHDKKATEVFQEAEQFKIRSGLTMIFRGPHGDSTIITLSSHDKEQSFRKYFEEESLRLIPNIFMLKSWFDLVHDPIQTSAEIRQLLKTINRVAELQKNRRQETNEAKDFMKALCSEVSLAARAIDRRDLMFFARIAPNVLEKFR